MESLIKINLLMKKKIEERIANNEDVFGRGFELKKINIDERYPSFIRKNKNILKDWIL